MKPSSSTEIVLKGISASPGICIGKAYLVDRGGVDVVDRYAISEKKVKNEVKRFKSAVQNAKKDLRAIIENSPAELQKANILETHVVLLNDKLLYGRTIEAIEKERVNAEWALKTVVNQIKAVFQEMPDPYLKERVSDIIHVSSLVMHNLMGAEAQSIDAIGKRVILVARDLSAADTSQINLERIKGFITDLGGKTSHTGIIARSLEIPAVVGLEQATRMVANDDIVIVDGTTGAVIVHPSEQTLMEYTERQASYERYRAVITRDSHLEARTPDGHRIDVMANIELPEEVVAVLNYGGDGIGLYRTEFQYLNRTSFPSENELFENYKDVIEVMNPRPVTFRTLDINGDKAMAIDTGFAEDNPALGLRAIRYCLKRPAVFKTQLRAILRAAALGSVRIMFPMISIHFEICEAKRLLDEAAESLEKDGLPYKRDIPLGAMIEVPSAVVIADLLAREVDFFSIGTNDLIQFALAIDRGNKQVAHLFQPLDPAVLRMIKRTADVAKDNGIKVGMCGEMANQPLFAPLLLGMGLHELSMNPQAIPVVKRMIRSIRIADTHALVQEVLKQPTALKVLAVLRGACWDLVTNHRQALMD
ncbi:MAG TPA: phosphoenolpyruvate--protein phosphotransferase [Desulfobacterales bacterium]|nr:phosphoenolpyruvate--protein phosphotransferase [Desulfobacterales bacterium]